MDVQIGHDAQVPIVLRDIGTGAPVTTAAGLIDYELYGPGVATALTSGTGVGTHQGSGLYTVPIDKAFLAVPGVFTLRYTVASPDIDDDEVIFTVGNIPAGAWRMRDLLVSLFRSLGGTVRTAQSVLNAVVTDSYFGGDAYGSLNGSELVYLASTVQSYRDWFAARVTSTNGTTGALTLNRSTAVTPAAAGDYALLAIRGIGFSFEQIVDELQNAYELEPITALVSNSVALQSVDNQMEYRLPDEFLSVLGVGVMAPGETDLWDDIGGRWEVVPDRRLLVLDRGLGLGAGHTLRVTGAMRCPLPLQPGSWTDVRGAWLRQRVRFGLLIASPNPTHQRAAQAIYADLVRQSSPFRRTEAGEVQL